ncbi:hypothetical protein EJD96_11820 [Herbaspirillum seropedicae]|nr:hypothetical protein EJD96_11820 [Herbaspirillum seropedicae]
MSSWHAAFNDKTVADATIDRVVHSSYVLELNGDSMRMPIHRSRNGAPERARNNKLH